MSTPDNLTQAELEARMFMCELHDGAGECTEECLTLMVNMNQFGSSREVFWLDDEARAVWCTWLDEDGYSDEPRPTAPPLWGDGNVNSDGLRMSDFI